MEEIWKQYIQLSQQSTTNFYHDYHPDSLFTAVMEDVEEAIADNHLGVAKQHPIIDVLDQSWTEFLDNTGGYNDWEAQAIAN